MDCNSWPNIGTINKNFSLFKIRDTDKLTKVVAANKDIGNKGEEEAVNYLRGKGFHIITSNYRFKRNEIDIIAKIDDLLVFIEVKKRSTNKFGYPETFVNKHQTDRIMKASEEYQYQINWQGPIRFDIISIEVLSGKKEITHFEDAFH